jgi:hypothetical protein
VVPEQNKPLVDKVVWAVIDGLSQDVYTEHAQQYVFT